MHIFERRHSNGLIIRVCGRLDRRTAVQFQEELDRRIDAGEMRIVIDLCELHTVNAAGIRAMLRASRHFAHHGGQLAFCDCHNYMRDKIRASGLHNELTPDQGLEVACHCLE